MNDKAGFACPFTAQSGMHSADGAVTRDGRCLLPSEVSIDWIFGSPSVRFSSFSNDKRTKRLKITDHPLVTTTATLLGVEQRRGLPGKALQHRRGLVLPRTTLSSARERVARCRRW